MKRLVSIIAAMCLMGNMIVSAAEITNISITEEDISSGEITVSGELSDTLTESAISVLVCDPIVTELDQSPKSLLPYIKGIGEGKTENQKFNISILLGESVNSGNYSFFISGENMETVYKEEFYVSPFEVKRKLDELNNSEADFSAKFIAFCDCAGIDYQVINAENYDKAGFLEKMFASKPENGFSGVDEVVSYFKACLGLQKIEDMEGAEEREEYILSNAEELMISKAEFEAFDKEIRLLICAGLDSDTLLSTKKLESFIFQKGVLCSFEKAQVWNTFKELVEKYPQYFELSEDEKEIYEDISDKNGVFKLMFINKPEADYSLEMLLELFVDSIYEQADSEDEKSSSKGSGGGSGGGGSKIAFDRTENKDAQEEQEVFTDIKNVSWAKDAILYLNQKGIISGVGEGKFLPDKKITREEFVKIIAEAFDLQTGNITSEFSDVDENAWYAPYIYAAAEAGIVNGISKTCFGVGLTVTRQDMAAMIYRAAKANGIDFSAVKDASFDDWDRVSQYARESVKSLANAGIINGMTENEFAPESFTTRAQAAKVIYGVLTKIAG